MSNVPFVRQMHICRFVEAHNLNFTILSISHPEFKTAKRYMLLSYLQPSSNILFFFDFIERNFFQNTLFHVCHTLKGYAKKVVLKNLNLQFHKKSLKLNENFYKRF